MKFSEDVAILGVVDPQDAAASAKSTDWSDVSKFERIAGITLNGSIAANIVAKLEQATSLTGASSKQLGICDLTHVASTADNDQTIIEAKADDLDTDSSFRFARLTLTPATSGTNQIAGLLVGYRPRYAPASDNDLASVTAIKDAGDADASV
jgi:hypothetical protein